MKVALVGLVSLALVVGAAPAEAAEARSPRLAQAAVDRAQLAMAGKRYVEAAEAMEEAYSHDKNPLWRANAGYAWMLAGQLDRAITQISEALGDGGLTGEARTRATDRLGAASSARALITRSEELRSRGDLRGAAEACDAALTHVPIGPYYLLAARLYEESGDLPRAEERYQTAVAEGDLSPGQQKEATEALVRVARAITTPAEPVPTPVEPPAPVVRRSNLAPWVVIGGGLAAGAVSGIAFWQSGERESEFEAAKRGDGSVALTRAEAESLESESKTWWTVGVITAAVAGVAVTTGIILLATSGDSEPEGSIHMGAAPIPGGGVFTASGRF